ncbi:hypothetical protein [Stenotrophomonas sp. VV52]|uniref:hypothetical protein n=1 Tax=Stenotrophomonas sp. VV52 TaxID=2066958 RepID=UPI0011AFC739|nr:hypothetical protein [Stenotrophomonas sp. VV52]
MTYKHLIDRFLDAGLSFIILDKETYLLELGINSRLRSSRVPPVGYKFSPSTQAVITQALNSGRLVHEISEVLGELAMPLKQISVVSDELGGLGIAATDQFGLRSRLELEHRLVVWSMYEPMLESLVGAALRIGPRKPDRIGKMRLTGEQALPWTRDEVD